MVQSVFDEGLKCNMYSLVCNHKIFDTFVYLQYKCPLRFDVSTFLGDEVLAEE